LRHFATLNLLKLQADEGPFPTAQSSCRSAQVYKKPCLWCALIRRTQHRCSYPRARFRSLPVFVRRPRVLGILRDAPAPHRGIRFGCITGTDLTRSLGVRRTGPSGGGCVVAITASGRCLASLHHAGVRQGEPKVRQSEIRHPDLCHLDMCRPGERLQHD
jgi:hypothetical protein